MLTSQLTIVDKQNWAGILKDNMDSKINTIINDDQTNLWFARNTKEIVTIGLLFNSFKNDFGNLRVLSRSVTKKKNNILHFDWPDEAVYSLWKFEHAMALEQIQMVAQDKEINWVDEEQTQGEQIQVKATQVAPQEADSAKEQTNEEVDVVTEEKKDE